MNSSPRIKTVELQRIMIIVHFSFLTVFSLVASFFSPHFLKLVALQVYVICRLRVYLVRFQLNSLQGSLY